MHARQVAALRAEGEARIQRLAWLAVEQEAYVKRREQEERIAALAAEGAEVIRRREENLKAYQALLYTTTQTAQVRAIFEEDDRIYRV